MTPNELTKKLIIGIVGFIGLCLMTGIAGNYERADEVILNMSQTAYEAVTAKLGKNASTVDIADEYLKNKGYYDSIY